MKKKAKKATGYKKVNIKQDKTCVHEKGIRTPSKRSRATGPKIPVGVKEPSWEELADAGYLRPIRNERDYKASFKVAGDLTATADLSDTQVTYLDTLTLVLEDWEKAHRTRMDLKHVTARNALEFLLEENGMNASDLGNLLGDRSLGSKILRRDRELSKKHIKILADRFCVEPGLFL